MSVLTKHRLSNENTPDTSHRKMSASKKTESLFDPRLNATSRICTIAQKDNIRSLL